MHNEGVTLTNEYWQAIIHNDSSYDSKFFLCCEINWNLLQTIMQIKNTE